MLLKLTFFFFFFCLQYLTSAFDRNRLHRRFLTSSQNMGSHVFVRLVIHLFWVKLLQEWNLTYSVRLFVWFVWAVLINCLVLFMFICVNSKRKSHLNQTVYLSAFLSAGWNLKIREEKKKAIWSWPWRRQKLSNSGYGKFFLFLVVMG